MDLIVTGADAGRFRNGAVAWEILNAAKSIQSDALELVDLSDCLHLKPYSVALLVAYSMSMTPRPRLILPNDQQCAEHLIRLGVHEYFDIDNPPVIDQRMTNVPVECLEDRSGSFASDAMEVWERQAKGYPPGIKQRLADHLDEVLLNSLTHADSSVGCVVCGQAFPKTETVEIAVVDLGRTIRGHLSAREQYRALDDEQAILAAIQEGVTGTVGLNRFNEPNSGVGLFELFSYCRQGGGELTILSGESYLTASSGKEPLTHRFRGGFPGTLVNVRFLTSLPLTRQDRIAINL